MMHDFTLKACIFAIIFVVAISLIVFSVAYALAGREMNRQEQYSNTVAYTVKSGDTLWGIAKRYALPSTDKREWIDKVIELNAHIRMQPGEVIYIYAAQESD